MNTLVSAAFYWIFCNFIIVNFTVSMLIISNCVTFPCVKFMMTFALTNEENQYKNAVNIVLESWKYGEFFFYLGNLIHTSTHFLIVYHS